MAKWFGIIGYAKTEETRPGVWQEQIIEREYYGDLTRVTKRWEKSGYLNDNINISNELSVVLDPYAYENFQYIKYATFNNVKWTVQSVEVQYPRLILSLGGVYYAESD